MDAPSTAVAPTTPLDNRSAARLSQGHPMILQHATTEHTTSNSLATPYLREPPSKATHTKKQADSTFVWVLLRSSCSV